MTSRRTVDQGSGQPPARSATMLLRMNRRQFLHASAMTGAAITLETSLLRAAERTSAPQRAFNAGDYLPRLPSLDDVMRGR